MIRQPPSPTLFPYTTLFRSPPARVPPGRILPLNQARILGSKSSEVGQAGARRSVALQKSAEVLRRVHVQAQRRRSEEHTSELQSRRDLVCRLLLEKKNLVNG